METSEGQKPRWRPWRVFVDRWFLLGAFIGLLVVVPKIALQYGINWGNYGESWVGEWLGAVTTIAMLEGVFGSNARYVYQWMLAGVIANGLVYAGVGAVLRRLVRAIRRRSS